MKNKFLALIPLALLLSSCDIGFSLLDGSHEKGADNGESYSEKIYEWFDGDAINYDAYDAHTFVMPKNSGAQDFNGHSEEDDGSQRNVSPSEEIYRYMAPTDTIMNSISNPQYVGKEDRGLKIGVNSDAVDGKITFGFSQDIVAVEILASPRAGYFTDKYGTQVQIDEETGISVNGSKYILLNSSFDEIDDITDTKCSYVLTNSSKEISLVVGKYRAVISEITFYTAK